MLPLLTAFLLTAGAGSAHHSTWLAFPGKGQAFMDYLAYDPAHRALWLPAGNRGQVFVLDVAAGTFRTVEGFATHEVKGRSRGPSSATVGDGVVFVGNRGDESVCAVDAATLKKRGCIQVAGMPDGIAYVTATREVWVTVPEADLLFIINASKPDALSISTAKTVSIDGDPEGYAVDQQAGVFYTNVENKDRTLAYDVKTKKLLATYSPECGADGPRGLALDAEHHRLFVACTDGARTLDLAHGGAIAGRLSTGAGVDNIDYDRAARQLLVASGKDGKLVIAQVDDAGGLKELESLPTAEGSRCVVADDRGGAYVPDGRGGRLMVVSPPKP